MKRLLWLMHACVCGLVLISCANSETDERNILYEGIPNGAVILDDIPTNRRDIHWVRWEYKGSCFMSSHIGWRNGMLTDFTCPDSIDRSPIIRNGKLIYINSY